jgi:hypothetical protein
VRAFDEGKEPPVLSQPDLLRSCFNFKLVGERWQIFDGFAHDF